MAICKECSGPLADIFSSEFYQTTQYGRDYAIGRNCRFLQGPKSDGHCVARLRAAIKAGQEFSETLLN